MTGVGYAGRSGRLGVQGDGCRVTGSGCRVTSKVYTFSAPEPAGPYGVLGIMRHVHKGAPYYIGLGPGLGIG